MNKKFLNIPLDEDTTILFESPMKMGEINCFLQIWRFDNIQGSSLIFLTSDLNFSSDEELKNWVKESEIIQNKEKITLSKEPNDHPFTFFNFDFKSFD
jgi:hypothetical protein